MGDIGSTSPRSTSQTLCPYSANWGLSLRCTHGAFPPRIATSSLTGIPASSTPTFDRASGPQRKRAGQVNRNSAATHGLGGNCFLQNLPACNKSFCFCFFFFFFFRLSYFSLFLVLILWI